MTSPKYDLTLLQDGSGKTITAFNFETVLDTYSSAIAEWEPVLRDLQARLDGMKDMASRLGQMIGLSNDTSTLLEAQEELLDLMNKQQLIRVKKRKLLNDHLAEGCRKRMHTFYFAMKLSEIPTHFRRQAEAARMPTAQVHAVKVQERMLAERVSKECQQMRAVEHHSVWEAYCKLLMGMSLEQKTEEMATCWNLRGVTEEVAAREKFDASATCLETGPIEEELASFLN